MRRTRFLALRALTLGAVLGASTTSWAGAPKPLSQSLTGVAKDSYTSATILYANGDFVGALAKFKQAYEESTDARLLFNMAICEKNLRHYARAQADLTRYEKEGGATLSVDDRRAVDDALTAIKNLVGSLTLRVSEAGAAVVVDGDPVGTSPLGAPIVLDLGRHRLTVRKAGFDSVDKGVEITGGADATASVTLVANAHAASLLVASDPGATVAVDGKTVGVGRFEGPEPAGTHKVTVAKTGMHTYEAEVDLRDGETRTLEVTLEGEGRPVIWPWIAGGAAVVAGAVVGGYFLFKSSPSGAPMPPDQLGSLQLMAWGR